MRGRRTDGASSLVFRIIFDTDLTASCSASLLKHFAFTVFQNRRVNLLNDSCVGAPFSGSLTVLLIALLLKRLKMSAARRIVPPSLYLSL